MPYKVYHGSPLSTSNDNSNKYGYLATIALVIKGGW